MADDLPTEYEDIILGTGLQESILAAALARIGRRVLHLDRNKYYSGEWASFHLQGILDWVDSYKEQSGLSSEGQEDTGHQDVEAGLELVAVPTELSAVYNLKTACYIRDAPEEEVIIEEAGPLESVATEQSQGAEGVADGPSGAGENPSVGGETSSDHHQSPSTVSGSSTLPVDADGDSVSPSSHLGDGAPESTAATGLGDSAEREFRSDDGSNDPQTSNEQSVTSGPEVQNEPAGSPDTREAGEPEGSDRGEAGESEQEDNPENNPETGGGGGNVEDSQEGEVEGQDQGQRVDAAAEAIPRRKWSWKEMKDQWRRFNVDLSPKLMFCRGSMVSILVQSRISRYTEFKAVSRLLTLIGDKLEHVPCSRSDVFSSRYVSMLEKRMLMKLIEFVLHYQERADDYEGFKDRPFSEFLQRRKLTPTLQHFVIHSIAMVTPDTATEEALEAMQFFLKSLGRYGNTAFLWTLYGSGELPQCFCRMSAVFGGIYMLRTTAKFLVINSEQNKCGGVIDSEGRRLTCSNVIMDHSYAVSTGQEQNCTGFVSRAVLFTDKTLKESEAEEITFLTIPPEKTGEEPIRLLEVGSSACASPKGIFVVHLTRKCRHTDPEKDLMPVVKKLFQDLEAELDCSNEKPKVLWSMFFSYQDRTNLTVDELRSGQPGGVYVTGGPGASVGYQHAVKQAQEIFELICPGEEFLPPAPNPEDIIYEDPSGDNPGHSKAGFEDVSEDKATPADTSSTTDNTQSGDIQDTTKDMKQETTEEESMGTTASDSVGENLASIPSGDDIQTGREELEPETGEGDGESKTGKTEQ